MFDLLVSSSVIVDDVRGAVRTVHDALGIAEPRPSWYAAAPGLDSVFCRTHPSLAVAPTRLELISPEPVPADAGRIRFYVPETVARQGKRPIKCHATVLASSVQHEIMERLARLGVRHRIDPSPPFPFPLVWLGTTDDEPSGYDPSTDAGLMLEVIDTQALRLPEETFAGDPGAPDDLDPGAFVRIVARGFLVDDLDDALRTLQASLGWEPAAPIATVAGEGYRMARMSFALAQSAALELIEPVADGDVARFAEQWGAGPYHVRISVNDLEAKADDLRRRGTAFVEVREVEGLPGRRLRLDPLPGLATRFELVAHRDVPSAG